MPVGKETHDKLFQSHRKGQLLQRSVGIYTGLKLDCPRFESHLLAV